MDFCWRSACKRVEKSFDKLRWSCLDMALVIYKVA